MAGPVIAERYDCFWVHQDIHSPHHNIGDKLNDFIGLNIAEPALPDNLRRVEIDSLNGLETAMNNQDDNVHYVYTGYIGPEHIPNYPLTPITAEWLRYRWSKVHEQKRCYKPCMTVHRRRGDCPKERRVSDEWFLDRINENLEPEMEVHIFTTAENEEHRLYEFNKAREMADSIPALVHIHLNGIQWNDFEFQVNSDIFIGSYSDWSYVVGILNPNRKILFHMKNHNMNIIKNVTLYQKENYDT
jgi:hypothetical protein